MPPRSRTPRKPGPVDIEVLRTRLEAGGRVRVGIRASGQFPDGAVGMVRRIGDPMTEGADFVQVETSIGGVKDVLPFAPADLVAPPARGAAPAVPSSAGTAPSSGGAIGRAASGRTTAAPMGSAVPGAGRATRSPAPTPSALIPREARDAAHATSRVKSVDASSGRQHRTPTANPSGDGDALNGAPAGGRAPTVAPAAMAGRGTVSDVSEQSGWPIAGPASAEPRAVASKSSAAGARPRRAPATITIASTEDNTAPWTVEARIGARVSLKATPVSPARVWEIVKTLGEPRLTVLVESLLAEHRKATQARADALTRELAAVRAELRAYPDADS